MQEVRVQTECRLAAIRLRVELLHGAEAYAASFRLDTVSLHAPAFR